MLTKSYTNISLRCASTDLIKSINKRLAVKLDNKNGFENVSSPSNVTCCSI